MAELSPEERTARAMQLQVQGDQRPLSQIEAEMTDAEARPKAPKAKSEDGKKKD
jgi:hypothetical protein